MRILLVLVGRTVPAFNEIADKVGRAFKSPVSLELIDFPMTRSYRSGRKQYDAEAFLKEMGRLSEPGTRTVFIVREDMFSGPLNFVFGLASEDACVVATARLDPRFYGKVDDGKKAGALFKERILKEIIHELGHTLGMPHCDDKKCVMVFSNSLADVDNKGAGFCKNCQKLLKTEG
ncbi:archaemetzincin family Zn-dependent metalloprotease [Candidatus Micrarchaeota archaeon]|nr:archaemetzincin family Zn-dependent metalloprotease [Candidatus Micrarchaeota archaeon]